MRLIPAGLLTIALLATVNGPLFAQQQWGDIKGQVIWAGKNIPPPKVINNKGCPCAKAVVDNSLIINPRNKGVQNVVVWLVDPNGKALPIHKDLKAIPTKAAVIDQPCCLFEPRATAIRAGQPLEIHNSAAIAHNALLSGKTNGSKNILIPPGKKEIFQGKTALLPEPRAISLACNIHGWMGGRIYVFDQPYFAITDADGKYEIKNAPSGNYLIYMQHELAGWLHSPRVVNNGVGGSKGQAITIPAGKALEMEPAKFKPEFLK